MGKKFWFVLTFFICLAFIALWKFWAWILWKILRLRADKQVFNLIGKNRFIELTGPSGKGKSWLLSHFFKHLQGVKFTNLPTPQNTYTLNRETLEAHRQGQWAPPNRWYYFLDDLDKFQKWTKKNFGRHGTKSLKDYFSHSGKLGETFIWTNNGQEVDYPFRTAKNATWKVVGYIAFMDYSLLVLWKTYWFTLIPIDNKEIESFYDPHWNIPQDYQKNWLQYIADRLKGHELTEILHMVQEGGNDTQWLNDRKFNRNLLKEYVRLRKIEEEVQRKKRQRASELKKGLKRYDLKAKPVEEKDLEKWDKEDKRKKEKREKVELNSKESEPTSEFANENEGMAQQSAIKSKRKKNQGGKHEK